MNFSVEHSLELLTRTPVLLRSLLSGLSEDWTSPNEGPDTWSAYDVVGHLVYAERGAWIGRAQLILSDASDKTFPPVDRFAQFTESKGKSLEQLLDEFAAMRSASVDSLRALAPGSQDLRKTGIHPAFGAVTLAQLLATWTAHDLDHIAQIVRVLAKQYKEAVGPWEANLKIMHQ